MKKKVLIVTEANERVASGHLFECIVCEKYFREHGMAVTLMVNADMSDELKQRIEVPFLTYKSDIQKEQNFFISFLNQNAYEIVLFNLREINNEFLINIKQNTVIDIICIDEFGNRRLDADVIVNPMIDESYWKYDSNAILYCGEQYLVLPLDLQKYYRKERQVNESIGRITVSMGGVDVGDSTIKLAEWLSQIDKNLEINLVLGGGYQKEKLLRAKIQGNERIHIFRNINYLSKLFFESDLAICAGGNTLHELAVIGTPTIVIPSMPHEIKNGKAYEKKGFSLCGSIASDFTYKEFISLYKKITPKEVRSKMCFIGWSLADGKGYERIYNIVSQR